MRHIHINSGKRVTALALLALASVVLAACGSSSNSSSTSAKTSAKTSATTSASATTPTNGTAAPNPGRFNAVRECLEKDGVTLPNRKARSGGASRSKLEAALKKCGFPLLRGGRHLFRSLAGTKAYEKFAACMRGQGVKLPAPNTSGKGPIFDTKGLDTTSPSFKSADAKCRPALLGAFHARPGGAPGAPPAG
jgi:hypothetical protein